jgi:putative transposase
MSKSLVKVYLHIVFSTKYRQKLITPLIKEELHKYLGGTCRELKCQPITVGGHVDHVHILCRLSPGITVSKLLEIIKSHSSKWVKERFPGMSNFYWQNGYGAFSLREEGVEALRHYIANQEQHHKKKSFQEEFLEMLIENNVEFDERYLWD